MSTLLEQVAQPRIEYKPPVRKTVIPSGRHVGDYDNCPDCGVFKAKTSAKCITCYTNHLHPPTDPSPYTVEGQPARRLPLTKEMYSFVDESLYEFLARWRFWAQICDGRPYAMTTCVFTDLDGVERRDEIKLHDIILGTSSSLRVDHANRDTLDNRFSNLRPGCTARENSANRKMKLGKSGYIGVWPDGKAFSVFISGTKRRKYVGRFPTALEGAVARDIAALEAYGEFAVLNFPDRIDEYRKRLTALSQG